MYKLLSRKLLGENYRSALKSIVIAVIIAGSLKGLEVTIPVAQSVLILTSIGYSMVVIWQVLSSADNAACLKGLFAMPYDDKKTLWEYAAVVCMYTFATKTSLLIALFYAFTKLTPMMIVIMVLSLIYSMIGTMTAFAFFRTRPYISAVIFIAGPAMAMLLPEGAVAAAVLAAADAAVMLIYSLQHARSFMMIPRSKVKKASHNGKPKMLVPGYIMRYMLENKSYIISGLVIIAFACYIGVFTSRSGMKFGAGVGMAFVSMNTPLSVIVSSNKSLKKKLDALPNKTKTFFVPYAVTLFIIYSIGYAVYLSVLGVADCSPGIRTFIAAPVFAAESAVFTAVAEDRFTLTNWKVESDLMHHPRKYILPVLLTFEAAAIFM